MTHAKDLPQTHMLCPVQASRRQFIESIHTADCVTLSAHSLTTLCSVQRVKRKNKDLSSPSYVDIVQHSHAPFSVYIATVGSLRLTASTSSVLPAQLHTLESTYCFFLSAAYLEEVSLTAPDDEGIFSITVSAGADQSCYSKSEGPYQVECSQSESSRDAADE